MKITPKEKKYLEEYAERGNISSQSFSDMLSRNLQLARNHIENLNRGTNLILAGSLYHLDCSILGKAGYMRLINSDLNTLNNITLISSRLRLLKNIIGGPDYGSTDCQHVWDLLFSLAVNDEVAINYHLSEYSPPFKKGHKFTKSVGNYLYALLLNRDDLFGKFSSGTRFDKSVQYAFEAIKENDHSKITESLTEVSKCYMRTDFAQHYHEKYICYFSMGLASLARRIRSYDVPNAFQAKGFDVELWHSMKSRESIDCSSFNVNHCKSLWEGISNPYETNLDNICTDLKANFEVVSPDELRI